MSTTIVDIPPSRTTAPHCPRYTVSDSLYFLSSLTMVRFLLRQPYLSSTPPDTVPTTMVNIVQPPPLLQHHCARHRHLIPNSTTFLSPIVPHAPTKSQRPTVHTDLVSLSQSVHASVLLSHRTPIYSSRHSLTIVSGSDVTHTSQVTSCSVTPPRYIRRDNSMISVFIFYVYLYLYFGTVTAAAIVGPT